MPNYIGREVDGGGLVLDFIEEFHRLPLVIGQAKAVIDRGWRRVTVGPPVEIRFNNRRDTLGAIYKDPLISSINFFLPPGDDGGPGDPPPPPPPPPWSTTEPFQSVATSPPPVGSTPPVETPPTPPPPGDTETPPVEPRTTTSPHTSTVTSTVKTTSSVPATTSSVPKTTSSVPTTSSTGLCEPCGDEHDAYCEDDCPAEVEVSFNLTLSGIVEGCDRWADCSAINVTLVHEPGSECRWSMGAGTIETCGTGGADWVVAENTWTITRETGPGGNCRFKFQGEFQLYLVDGFGTEGVLYAITVYSDEFTECTCPGDATWGTPEFSATTPTTSEAPSTCVTGVTGFTVA